MDGSEDAGDSGRLFRQPLREPTNLKHPWSALPSVRLGAVGHGDEREYRAAPGPTGQFAALNRRAAVFAARLRSVGRGRALAMVREPVLGAPEDRQGAGGESPLR